MKQSLLDLYRGKSAVPGLGAVLDPRDDGPKNEYLDFVHRRALRRFAPLLGSRVADLGCGIGRLTGFLAGERSVVGLDGSPELLAIARGRLPEGAPLVLADLTALPLASGAFTGALMAFVSMHFDDDVAARAFAETARILQPGGHFVILEHFAPGETDRAYHGVLDRSRASIERALQAAGFELAEFRPLKKSPSRVVHWVRTGRLPRSLWGLGAWLDARACGRSVERADYLECVVVARKAGGGGGARIEAPGLISLFVPRPFLR